jgi:hypothetical protein
LVRVGAPATQVGPPLDPIVDGDGMGMSAEDILQHPDFEAEAAAAAAADVPAEARGGGGEDEDEAEDEDEGDWPHEEDRDAWDEALVAHNVDVRLVDWDGDDRDPSSCFEHYENDALDVAYVDNVDDVDEVDDVGSLFYLYVTLIMFLTQRRHH